MIAHDKFTALAPVPASESARGDGGPGGAVNLYQAVGLPFLKTSATLFGSVCVSVFFAACGLRLAGSTAADCQRMSAAQTQIFCLPNMAQRFSIT